MTHSAFDPDRLQQFPVVGILRGFAADEIERAAGAAIEAGLSNLEVTMNTAGAGDLIAALSRRFAGKANIGAGTVCSMGDLKEALTCQASFIVTPTVVPAVIRECRDQGVPVFPGALSLTEMHQAFDLGATMVKLFPSEVFGPEYLRFIVESFPEWRLMPTGGVSVETLSFYRQAGARAFGVGTPLFDRRQIRARNWAWIGEQVQRFARAFRESRPVPSDA